MLPVVVASACASGEDPAVEAKRFTPVTVQRTTTTTTTKPISSRVNTAYYSPPTTSRVRTSYGLDFHTGGPICFQFINEANVRRVGCDTPNDGEIVGRPAFDSCAGVYGRGADAVVKLDEPSLDVCVDRPGVDNTLPPISDSVRRSGGGGSSGGGDLDCDDFSGAVDIGGGPDPHGLDADNDGVGCE